METPEESVKLVNGVIHFSRYQHNNSLRHNPALSEKTLSPSSSLGSPSQPDFIDKDDYQSLRVRRILERGASRPTSIEGLQSGGEPGDVTCYNVFVKLRRLPLKECSHVIITLEQRSSVNDEEIRAVPCLMGNTWRTRVYKLNGLRLVIKNAAAPRLVLARFPLTGLGLGKNHILYKGNGISIGVLIEPWRVPKADSNAIMGTLDIKLLDGEGFPFYHDDGIGPVTVVFLHSGQKVVSSNCPNTAWPRWMESVKLKLLDHSERSLTVLLVRADEDEIEELSRTILDFSNQDEGVIREHRLLMLRTDNNPVTIRLHLSYNFRRKLQWNQDQPNTVHKPLNQPPAPVSDPPDEPPLPSPDHSYGILHFNLFYWSPINGALQNSLVYVVVKCGSNYVVTESTTRATQKSGQSVTFPLYNIHDVVDITVFEDGLYESREVGRLLVPPATLNVAVSSVTRSSDMDHRGLCEVRYQTKLTYNPWKYVAKTFQLSPNIFISQIDEQSQIEKAVQTVESIVRTKQKIMRICCWKDKLFSLVMCLFALSSIIMFELYLLPLLLALIIIKNLASVKVFTRRIVSLTDNPLIAKSLFNKDKDKPNHPDLACRCSDSDLCHTTNLSEYREHGISKNYTLLFFYWTKLLDFIQVTFDWIVPLYTVTLLGLMLVTSLVLLVVPFRAVLGLVVLHSFTKSWCKYDLGQIVFNFVMNAPSVADLGRLGSV